MQGTLCCTKRTKYDKHMKLLERRILIHSPFHHRLKTKDTPIQIFNPISKKTEDSWIHSHTLINKDSTRPHITFIHGFGGSSATYLDFKTQLSKFFSIHSVDLLGMGCSGKPNIKWIKLSAKQIVEIYVSSLEQWREGMGIEKLDFVGHSLGSYFSTFYAAKYPERVNSICGMSTPCATAPPPGFDPKKLKLNTKRKLMYYFWSFMNMRYVKGYTAFSAMPMKKILSFWLKGRMNYSEEKKKAIIDFLGTMFWDKRFSCDIITGIMGYLGYTDKLPLTTALEELKNHKGIKIKYFYGNKDWLDYEEFEREVEEFKYGVEVEIVEGIAHQMPKLEPERVSLLVKKFYDSFDEE